MNCVHFIAVLDMTEAETISCNIYYINIIQVKFLTLTFDIEMNKNCLL